MKVNYYVVMVGDKPLVIYGEKPSVSSADMPRPIQLAEDDIVKVRYDAQAMRWIPNRPSRIKYPTLGN